MRKTVIAALQLCTVLLSCAFAQQAPAPSAVSDKDINLLVGSGKLRQSSAATRR